jgi:hypothetical protein
MYLSRMACLSCGVSVALFAHPGQASKQRVCSSQRVRTALFKPPRALAIDSSHQPRASSQCVTTCIVLIHFRFLCCISTHEPKKMFPGRTNKISQKFLPGHCHSSHFAQLSNKRLYPHNLLSAAVAGAVYS